ncbi:hypothetical protein VOLCADRAFT_108383 [Volvox carteri f. nagariensis]|uniref:Pherophorin domain-containing protein n=1 Tax=Volvox carteri f. nagariensis TaxID=3068 RepID=D8UJV1_VOLCA|nr:uncharacterized protein VOLCADRAFT_108383 [Volvox carteri f. nagariensis]EFJ40019.1 hypothetical protein VOLCADRAFT_108383 [Volvox carteri f. nagariensis]|eukprot:XP_002958939.1 hypothetical protein VOLCADRAFT_108383 [Volvox carteri f. nagariensis]
MAFKVVQLGLLSVLVGVAVTGVQVAASGNSFPFSQCESSALKSPYRVKYDGFLIDYDNQDWTCFRMYLDTDAATDCPAKATDTPDCCSPSLAKIEFNAAPSCEGYVTKALMFKGYDDSANGVVEKIFPVGIEVLTPDVSAVIRISKGLNLDQSVLAKYPEGLPFCLNRKPDVCSEAQTYMYEGTAVYQYAIFDASSECCPTGCKSFAPTDYPWRAVFHNVTEGKGGQRVCMKLYVDEAAAATCNNAVGCCTQRLQKVEILANRQCRGSISQFTMTGVTGTKSSFLWHNTFPTLKFTNLNLPYKVGEDGAFLCFSIKGPSCTNLQQLCSEGPRGCEVATFAPPGNSCCPINYMPYV